MTTGAVLATTLFASIVAALGFTMSNSSQFTGTIDKMVTDFFADGKMQKFQLLQTAGPLMVVMYLYKGATMLSQEVVAWVQSWLAKNGVYNTSGITPSDLVNSPGWHYGVPLSSFSNPTLISCEWTTTKSNSINMTKELSSKILNFCYNKLVSEGNWYSDACTLEIRQYTTNAITVVIQFPSNQTVSSGTGSINVKQISDTGYYTSGVNPTTYAQWSWSGSRDFGFEFDFFGNFIKTVTPSTSAARWFAVSSVITADFGSSYPSMGWWLLGTADIPTIGLSPSDGSLPTADATFPTEVGVKTEVDGLNTWLNKQLEAELERVTDVVIDGAATVAGELEKVLAIPIAIPGVDVLNPADVMSKTQEEAQDAADTTEDTKEAARENVDIATGGGGGAAPALPCGPTSVSSTDLYSLWNPSSAELSELASFMWSTDFVDTIKKIVSNPMDTIIGLTMVPIVPPQGSDAVLKLGLVSTGVTMTRISTQFTKFDCGSITIPRAWNNYLDYEPYTVCHLFLPFVGIVPLRTNEIMNATLSLTYNIDLLSGACTALLYVARDEANICMYTYGGNLSAPVPITSADFSRLYAGAISAVGNVGLLVASGGSSAAAQLAAGTATMGALGSMRTQVSHSGNVSGNAGLLGGFTPYIFFDRPIPDAPANYQTLYGKRANEYTNLGSVNGFTKVQEVHVDGFVATDAEKTEIEALLKSGVIL